MSSPAPSSELSSDAVTFPAAGGSSPADRWSRAAIVVLALTLLAAPFMAWQFPSLAGDAQTELRVPASRPALPHNAHEFRLWPARFDAYLNDHVPGRSELIGAWSATAAMAHASSSRMVLLGDDGWLFLRRDHSTLDRSRGLLDPSPEQLGQWVTGMRDLWTEINAVGAVPWLVVVPGKSTVYPEYLPDWAQPAEESTTGQIIDALRAARIPHVLDLRPALTEAKPQGQLYWLTDTHWNGRGALVAYQAIMDDLARHGVQRPRAELALNQESLTCDLSRLLGRSGDDQEAGPVLQVLHPHAAPVAGYQMRYESFVRHGYRATAAGVPPAKLLVFGDSFTEHGLWAALQESFSSMTVYHHGELRISRRVLRDEKPSVVLIIIAQRLLPLDGPHLVD